MNINFEYSQSLNMFDALDATTLRLASVKSFEQAYNRGRRGQLLAKIFNKESHLRTLDTLPISSSRHTSRIVTVPIRKIKGSLDRSEDFDTNFNPLKERNRSRWISILNAIRSNIPLPPVELVQVGDTYYVQDGHHRISVARSLDQEAIEARIVN
jgi:hypothetical protein